MSKKECNNSKRLQQMLDNADYEVLKRFFAEYADKDEKLKAKLIAEFGEPSSDKILVSVKEEISQAIQSNSYRGFIDWNGCDQICRELSEILSQAEFYIEKGYFVLGFQIALLVLIKGMWLATNADSSSGMLSEILYSVTKVIDNACAKIDDSGTIDARKTVFELGVKEFLNKVFVGWGEQNYMLLRSVSRFLTNKNSAKFFAALDKFIERNENSSLYIADDRLTRLYAIRVLDGEDAARKFIYDNIDIDCIRREAINSAIEKQDYSEAERLCVERIAKDDFSKDWSKLLYSVYEKADNDEKMLETAKILLLRGELSYYDNYKSLLIKTGNWKEQYPTLLFELKQKFSPWMYAFVLEKEQEWKLLMTTVENSNDDLIFKYAEQLVSFYPENVYLQYSKQIEKLAHDSSVRRQYAAVCSKIKELYKLGGTDRALQLITDFTALYKRRSAMIEELEKLEKKLLKSQQ